MKRVKIIDSGFDKETGISHITIASPKGTFTGYSTLQEEDEPYISAFAGCRYAELKAHIKMLNFEIRELKAQLSAFQKFYKHISQGKQFNSKSYEASKLRKQIYELEDKIDTTIRLRDNMYKTLMTAIDERQSQIDQLHKSVEALKKVRGSK